MAEIGHSTLQCTMSVGASGEKGNDLLRHLNYSEMMYYSGLERAAPTKSRAKKHLASLPRVDNGMRHSVRPSGATARLHFKEGLVLCKRKQ